MVTSLVSLLNKALMPAQVQVNPIQARPQSANPFANPFVSNNTSSNFYGKNNPVRGGYFAGYYNGKPNIVGKRLFIEV